MKTTRAQAAQNRQRILDMASRAFRAKGFEGCSVADITTAAGLTHGGFYGHFASKSALEAEACAAALGSAAARWAAAIADSPDEAFESIVNGYLTERHRDSPAIGCAFAALAAEASRREPEVRGAFTEGLKARLDLLARAVGAKSSDTARERAIAAMSSLVGAMVLARVVDDPELSAEILVAVRSQLT